MFVARENGIPISTHTPLAGRDAYADDVKILSIISTHTPLAGRDLGGMENSSYDIRFLLTRPSRDVTLRKRWNLKFPKFLLTRPSRDVTKRHTQLIQFIEISTHTPLAGRDQFLRTY